MQRNRTRLALACAASVALLVGGCVAGPGAIERAAPSSPSSVVASAPPGTSLEASATAHGLSLELRVTRSTAATGTRVSAAVDLRGTGDPVTLRTPGGSRYVVKAVSPEGKVAFDSSAVDRVAIASVPVGRRPGESMVIDSSQGEGSEYRFTLKGPARYTITAATFSPRVSTPPLTVTVP